MNMSKRLYVSPKLTVVVLDLPKPLCASLPFDDKPTDTSGRSIEYDDSEHKNGYNYNNDHWGHLW